MKLTRPSSGAMIGGVCAGIARYLNLDVTIIRIAFVLIAVFGGSGILAYLMFQTFINIGMNIGLVPATGIPLPFISYGGSSTLALSVCCGLLLAFTRRNPYLDQSPYLSKGR